MATRYDRMKATLAATQATATQFDSTAQEIAELLAASKALIAATEEGLEADRQVLEEWAEAIG